MGPSSPSQEGLFTDLRLLSLEKQLNIELKVDIVKKKKNKNIKSIIILRVTKKIAETITQSIRWILILIS